MTSIQYGILSGISLAGLLYSFWGGTGSIIGAVAIGLSNAVSISLSVKENCPRPETKPVVATSVTDDTLA